MVAFLAYLILAGVSFAFAGFLIGYLPKPGESRGIWICVVGLLLAFFGILGAASIGLVIYPIGMGVFGYGLGRRAKNSTRRRQSIG